VCTCDRVCQCVWDWMMPSIRGGRAMFSMSVCVCKVEVTEEVLARNRKRTTTPKQKQSKKGAARLNIQEKERW
jgi:hypothetical protein